MKKISYEELGKYIGEKASKNLEEKWHKWQKSSMEVNMKAIKRDV